MSFGSRSAQTPSESSQQAASNQLGENNSHYIELSGFLMGNESKTYQVFHKWRKVGSASAPGAVHHSQIFVVDPDRDFEVQNFGLFSNSEGNVVFEKDNGFDTPEYHVSASYKPNPVQATGKEIVSALANCSARCGPKYKLLHNNCQKYARLVMTTLGAKHHRDPLHP